MEQNNSFDSNNTTHLTRNDTSNSSFSLLNQFDQIKQDESSIVIVKQVNQQLQQFSLLGQTILIQNQKKKSKQYKKTQLVSFQVEQDSDQSSKGISFQSAQQNFSQSSQQELQSVYHSYVYEQRQATAISILGISNTQIIHQNQSSYQQQQNNTNTTHLTLGSSQNSSLIFSTQQDISQSSQSSQQGSSSQVIHHYAYQSRQTTGRSIQELSKTQINNTPSQSSYEQTKISGVGSFVKKQEQKGVSSEFLDLKILETSQTKNQLQNMLETSAIQNQEQPTQSDKMKNYEEELKQLEETRLIEKIFWGEGHEQYQNTQDQIGLNLIATAKYQPALDIFLHNLTINQKNENLNYSRILNNLNNIGDIFIKTGKLQKAFQYLGKGLKIIETKANLSNNYKVLKSQILTNIGIYYQQKADYKKALQRHFQSLQIIRKQFGQNSLEESIALHKIGKIYVLKAEVNQGLKYYLKSLQIKKQKIGLNNQESAELLNNIGTVYGQLRKLTQALQYFQQALEIRKQLFGQTHPDYAQSLSSIGVVYLNKTDYRTALEYYFKCQQIRKKTFGQNHYEYIKILSNIGYAYQHLAEYDNALQYFFKCLKISKIIFDQFHPNNSHFLNGLGNIYFLKGEYQKALEIFQKSLSIVKKFYGQNSYKIVHQLVSISAIYATKGDYDKALQNSFITLQIMKKAISKEQISQNQTYFNLLSNIGQCYCQIKQYSKSLQYFSQAEQSLKKTLGLNSYHYGILLCNIGNSLFDLGRFEQSLEIQKKGLQIIKSTIGENNYFYGQSLCFFGRIQNKLNQSDDICLENMLKGSQIVKKTMGQKNKYYANQIMYIAEVYQSKGQIDKALEYYQRSLSIKKVLFGQNYFKCLQLSQKVNELNNNKSNYKQNSKQQQKQLKISQ